MANAPALAIRWTHRNLVRTLETLGGHTPWNADQLYPQRFSGPSLSAQDHAQRTPRRRRAARDVRRRIRHALPHRRRVARRWWAQQLVRLPERTMVYASRGGRCVAWRPAVGFAFGSP